MEREKVLVWNQRGRTKWLTGIIIRRKSPATYLVRMATNSVSYCHSDHLLHGAGSTEGECQPTDSGYAPETVVANMNEDAGGVSPPATTN